MGIMFFEDSIIEIIKELFQFKSNYVHIDNKILCGDFYTRLRRVYKLYGLTIDIKLSNIRITIQNSSDQITEISFHKTSYNCNMEQIDALNNIIRKNKKNFILYIEESKINRLLNEVKNYKI